ncbi:BlaI/MecI/CopY family transcriptional regulator [Schlesneria paludicola]|uniref:BlaI/MecI/CopY family transcriptional regulator n=1 Tax=Schlesneria paludicola TaxID=360056 RepID=UPI000299D11B|nr:BlaI/MecI/CopY family transcriptional regulator [Schlesneria paludicola]
MAAPKAFITDTELVLLKVLWSDQPLTAREIASRLYGEESASAIGTVQKLIQRLEEKELVLRDRREPVHRFSTRVTRDAVAGMQLQELAAKLSDGSLSPFIMHMVQAERLSPIEKQALRRLLEEQ